MSKSTDPSKNSISSAIFGLQDTLQFHALGPVNLDKARDEFSQQINSIRNICSQFETEVLGDVMKMGVGADPAFRKHFTHLKEQAALESTVIRLKEILISSKEQLELPLKEKEESKSKIEIQRLEKLAQSMGLITFVDSSKMFESDSPTSTITLGGTLIVIDIDIDDKGKVQKTKVTYVSESMQSDQDDRVDKILTENLQLRKFDLFKRNLWSLALLDQLNIKYKPLDFFSITKNLLQDLKAVCLIESEIEFDFSSILTEGHGIPCLHLSYPGISIAYWLDKPTIASTDWNQVKQLLQQNENHDVLLRASKILISFEDSTQLMHYLPLSRPNYLLAFDETEDSIKEGVDGEHFKVVYENSYPKFMSPMRYVKPLPTIPDSVPVPVRFVATVEPPIAMADELCQTLMNVIGLLNTEAMEQYAIKNTSQCPSLEEILVPNIMLTKQYVKKLLYAQICHIFNEAHLEDRSAANVSVSLKDILAENEKDNYLILEVATMDAPYSIHMTLAPPQGSSFVMVPLSIDIPTDDPTKPIVRLHSSPIHKWNMNVFNQDLMTKELQSHYNVPLFIRWLFDRMSQESFIKRERMDIDDDLFKKSIKTE
ncbi:hypothetical protein G6F43_000788 [Rhizopus delemar]|nr:hypothetical protein G6F43_000788 [Rhizopus delemar]